MTIIADESVDFPIIERLRNEGYTVQSISETNSGIDDETVLMIATQQSSLLLTADKDFGTLVFLMRRANHGVVLYRLHGSTMAEKCDHVALALKTHWNEILNSFTVISARNVRIRPMRSNSSTDDNPS